MRYLPPSTTSPLQTVSALPAGHGVALTPWFTKQIVEQGFDLLHDDEVRFFSFQRRYGGLVTDEDIVQLSRWRKARASVVLFSGTVNAASAWGGRAVPAANMWQLWPCSACRIMMAGSDR
ncbi:MAG: hypothetical protein JRF04_03000 [Deltaproteobacteria bacterium]|nr:hypothetical protein [Deltaproteobacteria bacterium]